MGLDMYLNARRIAFDGERLHRAIVDSLGTEAPKTVTDSGYYVVALVTTWRKANQVHAWFVDNVQSGIDDQREYSVDRQQLEDLLDRCQKVQADHSLAARLLPTRGGFFFGSTDYDELYFADVDFTIDELQKALEIEGAWEFFYGSWW
jgi:hypothetical protein